MLTGSAARWRAGIVEADVSCRGRRGSQGTEGIAARQYKLLQFVRGQKVVELHGMQAKLANVIAFKRFMVMNMGNIKPLSGQQGEQEQEANSVPLSRHRDHMTIMLAMLPPVSFSAKAYSIRLNSDRSGTGDSCAHARRP